MSRDGSGSRRELAARLEREGYRLAEPGAAGASRRRLILTVVAVVAFSLTLGALFGRRGLLDLVRYKREHVRLTVEIDTLRAEVSGLEAELHALRHDPLAMERLAREELALARPGEVVVFLEPGPLERPAPSLEAPASVVTDSRP